MQHDTINGRSASEIAKQLESNEFSSVALVQYFFDRIQSNADQSIFTKLTEDRALGEANASDERRQSGKARSPWDGIPIAWKDLFDLKGEITTAGSAVYRNDPPATSDADVVAACEKLGLICLGKTNLSEFAYSGLGLNPHFGTPHNPAAHGEPRAPGGSSSGSAVAVAAGLAPVAIGTDTAGSIRVPASFCGVAGFKSSQTRYSKKGVFPLSTSLDSLGAFAHSVEDLIQIDAMMRGRASAVLDDILPVDLTLVVPQSVVFDDVEPAILTRFEELEGVLAKAGMRVERKAFPIFDEVAALFKTHGTPTVAEAFTLHEALLNSDDADRIDQRVRERMLTARQFNVQDYIRLQWARERLQQETIEQLGHKFLLFPTTPITAPKISALEASDDLFKVTNLTALRNTMMGNYLGTPGVSLPVGTDSNGLPVGALISAPFGHDDHVLAAARTVEKLIKSAC